MKTCGECGASKPLSDFYKRSRSKDQYDRKCKACSIKIAQAWKAANRERYREKSRAWNSGAKGQEARRRLLLKRYGLTAEEFERKLLAQGGVCAVCGGDNAGSVFNVDHDHLTMGTRDLLCNPCNLVLGQVKESIPQLEALIGYLRRWHQQDQLRVV